ncbi:MAG: hypothetical protein E6767_07070 [Dysgonomonas sp.]|nr:hypothetical protein [Dysgonomonas sp.]
MDATFNIERFSKLEKRDFYLSKQSFLYIIGGLIGLYILSLILQIVTENNLSTLIYMLSFITIGISPCFLEKPINKNTSVFDFIMPVSTFERFFSMWIKYVLLVPGMIFGVILILNLVTGLLPFEDIQVHTEAMAFAKNLSFKKLYSVIAFQSYFLLAYFYFRKYAFAKASLIVILFTIGISVIAMCIAFALLHGQEVTFSGSANTETSSAAFQLGFITGKTVSMKIPDNPVIKIADTIIDIIVPLGFWIVSYFKLKETEI